MGVLLPKAVRRLGNCGFRNLGIEQHRERAQEASAPTYPALAVVNPSIPQSLNPPFAVS